MSTTINNQPTPCAEIITSSLDSFTAHCWQWDAVPPFGSIVLTKTSEYLLYGVVYNSKTESLDPMHTVHVYKKTESEMKKEYPHLFDYLKTTFDVFVLGHEHEREKKIAYSRAPFPARLYSFVSVLDLEQLKNFFENHNSFSRLMNNQNIVQNYEDLLLALISQQKKLGILSEEQITKYISSYSNAIQARYVDLQNFIAKIENL